jgi:3-deoxy-manno-octulosonate cytidylyltransferase (CMP-KDO synthetase)
MTKIVGIIPARYASTRFPGKPLIDIGGKTMIQRVYEQSKKSQSLADVVVATDDERIEKHVLSFGGKVVITSSNHQSGTDRCFEAIEKFDTTADVVINIQGDEPFIHPEQIDIAAKCFSDKNVLIATLAKKISASADLFNPNVPKVIIDKQGNAIYFSRHPLPYLRGKDNAEWHTLHTYYKHIGLYAYRKDVLSQITALKQSALELAESLEQLRWLENGYKIKVEITDYESVAIDAPEDLKKLEIFL